MSGLRRIYFGQEENKVDPNCYPREEHKAANCLRDIRKAEGVADIAKPRNVTKDKSSTLDSFMSLKSNEKSKNRIEDEIKRSLEKVSLSDLLALEQTMKVKREARQTVLEYSCSVLKETQMCQEFYKRIYKAKREDKQKLDPRIGCYTDDKNGEFKFVYGTQYLQLLKQHKEAKLELDQLKEVKKMKQKTVPQKNQKKNLSTQDKIFDDEIKYKHKELEDLLERMQVMKGKCQHQRIKCKLAWREKRCYFSEKGWGTFRNRYQVLELIGAGGFGEVYRVYDYFRGEEIAMKLNIIYKQDDDEDTSGASNKAKHIYREIQTHNLLNHIRIAKYYDTYQIEEEDRKIIVSTMEICQGQDLNEYLKQSYQFTQKQAKTIIKQLLEALCYLASLEKKVIHYDLKPHNILYFEENIKIIDFGLCKTLEQDKDEIQLTSMGTGTMYYLPPQTFETVFLDEQLENNREEKKRMVSTSIDMWAVGVIFYELLYGVRPFGVGMSQMEIFNSGMMKKQLKVNFPAINHKNISVHSKDFITKCFYEQGKRMTAKEGLEHICFKK